MARTRKTELDLDVIEAPLPPPVTDKKKEEKREKKKKLPSPGFKKKIIIIISAVFILFLGMGLFLIWTLISHVEKEEEVIITIPPPKIDVVPLQRLSPFLLPISAKNGEERFLKMGIAFELSEFNLRKEIEKNIALVRDKIFLLIKKKSLANIRSPANRMLMRKEIKNIVNMALQSGTVKKVYFTELIIL